MTGDTKEPDRKSSVSSGKGFRLYSEVTERQWVLNKERHEQIYIFKIYRGSKWKMNSRG